jgi:transposase
VIRGAACTPDLNLIERFSGHLKRTATHNRYFQTVESLEEAVTRAIHHLNCQPDHPLRLQLTTAQPSPRPA